MATDDDDDDDTFEHGDGESEDIIQDVFNKFEEYCNSRRNTQIMSGISSNVATRMLANPERAT